MIILGAAASVVVVLRAAASVVVVLGAAASIVIALGAAASIVIVPWLRRLPGPPGALASCLPFSSAVGVSAAGVFCVTLGAYEPPVRLEARNSSKELRMNLAT